MIFRNFLNLRNIGKIWNVEYLKRNEMFGSTKMLFIIIEDKISLGETFEKRLTSRDEKITGAIYLFMDRMEKNWPTKLFNLTSSM